VIITSTEILDVLIIEPHIFEDDRGFFFESYNEQVFMNKTGVNLRFVQDNHSHSKQYVLRGLHYQIQHAQGKLVRALVGAILDVAVDLRQSSPSFGHWVSCLLSSENQRQVWIPPGFAHGFLVLSETADVAYKTTDYYAPQYERCLLWNDPDLAIDWCLTSNPQLSLKDQAGIPLKSAEVYPCSEFC
jgi:dTDP-4-dehydrorhamnose 3,5-epimerase